MKKALFIDRDGTIIREPADEQIDSLEKLEFVPGAISALRSLAGRGYELVMVSNQDGLGTPSFPEETFWPAHNKMLATLAGEGVRFDYILTTSTEAKSEPALILAVICPPAWKSYSYFPNCFRYFNRGAFIPSES